MTRPFASHPVGRFEFLNVLDRGAEAVLWSPSHEARFVWLDEYADGGEVMLAAGRGRRLSVAAMDDQPLGAPFAFWLITDAAGALRAFQPLVQDCESAAFDLPTVSGLPDGYDVFVLIGGDAVEPALIRDPLDLDRLHHTLWSDDESKLSR